MLGLNIGLLLHTILPILEFPSVFSIFVAIIFGSIVGIVIKLIFTPSHPIITPAIFGSFFGTMLFAMLPIFSNPELTRTGLFGTIPIIQSSMQLVPPGAIGGALVGIIGEIKLPAKHKKPVVAILLVLTYTLITATIYIRLTLYCYGEFWHKLFCWQ